MSGTVILKTGRSRSVEVGGTITGVWANQFSIGVDPETCSPLPYGFSGTVGFKSPFGGSVVIQPYSERVDSPPGFFTADYKAGYTLLAGWEPAGFNVGTVFSSGWNPKHLNTECVNWLQSYAATATIVVPVEEFIYVAWNDQNQDVRFTDDGPGKSRLTFYERTVQGGTATVTISSAGTTVSISGTVTTATDFPSSSFNLASDQLYYECLHYLNLGSQNLDGTITYRTHYGATGLNAPFSDAASNASGSASISLYNGVDATLSGTASSLIANCYISPPRAYTLNAIVRHPSGYFSGTLGLDRQENGGFVSGTAHSNVNSVNGSVTTGGTQYDYAVGGLYLAGNSRDGTAVQQWNPLQVQARPGSAGDGDSYSLLSLAEDSRDRRALFRAYPPYDAFTIAQVAFVTVDAGTSLTPSGTPYAGSWVALSGGTVDINSGSVRFIGTAIGSLMRSFVSPADGQIIAPFGSYRYLDIPIKASGSANLAFTFSLQFIEGMPTPDAATKTWTTDWLGSALVAGTIDGTVRIDLCSPANRSDTLDLRDSRLPFFWDISIGDMPGPFPGTAYSDGPYWGVTYPGSAVFSSIAIGTIFIGSVALRRQEFSRLEVLPGFSDWAIAADNGTAVPLGYDNENRFCYVRRNMFGVTDGKRSLEICDTSAKGANPYIWDTSLDYVLHDFDSVFERNIENLHSQLQIGLTGATDSGDEGGSPHYGWSGTMIAGTVQPPEGTAGTTVWGTVHQWMNRYRPGGWIRGAGMMREGTVWTFTDALDVSSTVTLKAQFLCDRINWHPDIGNICELGSAAALAGPITLDAAYMLRGGVEGLVLTLEGTPDLNRVVSLYDERSSVNAGSGTAGTIGWYRTDAPFFHGTHSILGTAGGTNGTVVYQTTALPAFGTTLSMLAEGENRIRRRACWRPSGATWIAYDVSPAGRHIRAYVQANRLQIGYASNATLTSWTDRDMGTIVHQPCVRFHEQSSLQRAYLIYGAGTAPGTVTPGTVMLSYTPDEGGSLVEVATIFASGRWPRMHIAKDGRKLCYAWITSSIIGKILDAQDNTIISQFTAVSGGVDDDAIDCHEFYAGGGRWGMKLVYRSGGAIVDAISYDGVNFA